MKTNSLLRQFEKYISTIDGAYEEVHAAQIIQQMLLNDDVPQSDEVACVGVSIPADQLSGDYYDFIYDQDNGHYWVLIGDVMGKGVPASFLMVMVRSTVRCLVRTCAKPSELMFELNNMLVKDLSRLRSFSTLFCSIFNVRTGEFTYTSAGHPSPLFLKREQGEVQRLQGRGTVIGVLENRTYEDFSVKMAKGDVVLGYTDGIIEAMNREEKQYGYDRLTQIVLDNYNQNPTELIQTITNDVKNYSEHFRRDDITLVVVRCEKGDGS